MQNARVLRGRPARTPLVLPSRGRHLAAKIMALGDHVTIWVAALQRGPKIDGHARFPCKVAPHAWRVATSPVEYEVALYHRPALCAQLAAAGKASQAELAQNVAARVRSRLS